METLNEAIERRVRSLETKESLDIDAVERAVERIRDPDVLRTRLGDAIRYSQRVEAEVAGLSIEILLPHERDQHLGRFLTVWVPDETGHAIAQERLLKRLDLPTYVARDDDSVPLHNRIAGRLTRLSDHAYDMVSMIYHAIGAINERLAMGAYEEMARVSAELGEDELAEVLLTPMRRDESQHLGYYRTSARQIRKALKPWQLTVCRFFIVHTYAPVGAGEKRDKAPMGRALEILENDPEDPSIGPAVQKIAEELLADEGDQLPPFVQRSLQRCVDLARAEAAA